MISHSLSPNVPDKVQYMMQYEHHNVQYIVLYQSFIYYNIKNVKN